MSIARHGLYLIALTMLSLAILFGGTVTGEIALNIMWSFIDISELNASKQASGRSNIFPNSAVLSETQFALRLIVKTLPVVVLCLAAHLFARMRGWYSPYIKASGLPSFARWFAAGIIAIGLPTSLLILLQGGSLAPGRSSFELSTIIGPFTILAIAWSVQGFSEEILFRGLILPATRRRIGLMGALIFNGVFFSFLHAGTPADSALMYLNIGIFAIFTCLLVVKSGHIWGAVGLHAGWNFAQSYLIGLPVSGGTISHRSLFVVEIEGPGWLTGGGTGLEGSLLTTVLFGAAVMIYLLKWEPLYARDAR